MNGQTDINKIVRVLYHTGQLLTAKDFEDEQKYHSDKIRLFFKRFPTGVIRGLKLSTENPMPVVSDKSVQDKGIYITSGIGVAGNGDLLIINELQTVFVNKTPGKNEISPYQVGVEYLFIPYELNSIANYEKLYVNIKLDRRQFSEKSSPFDVSIRKNREEETVLISFEEKPSGDGESITLGMIIQDDNKNIISAATDARREAAITPESFVLFDDTKGHDHSGEGNKGKKITSAGLADDAVVSEKIKNGAVTQDKVDPEVRTKPGGPAGGGDLEGTYNDGPTIRPGAVTSEKIAVAREEDRPDASDGHGIRTSHIRNGAVTNAKLAEEVKTAGGDLVGTYPNPLIGPEKVNLAKLATEVKTAGGDLTGSYPNPLVGFEKINLAKLAPEVKTAGGDLTGHYPNPSIADNSITFRKLAQDIKIAGGDLVGNYPNPTIGIEKVDLSKLAPEVKTAGGDLVGNYPNPIIGPEKVDLSKLAPQVKTAGGDLVGNYPNPSIRDETVTCGKLNIIHNTTVDVTLKDVDSLTVKIKADINVMLQVLPVYQANKIVSISWKTDSIQTIQDDPGHLIYTITISKLDKENVLVQIRAIKIGKCKDEDLIITQVIETHPSIN